MEDWEIKLNKSVRKENKKKEIEHGKGKIRNLENL